MDIAAELETLDDLDARHEALLAEIDALDRRVEHVLSECLLARQQSEGVGARGSG